MARFEYLKGDKNDKFEYIPLSPVAKIVCSELILVESETGKFDLHYKKDLPECQLLAKLHDGRSSEFTVQKLPQQSPIKIQDADQNYDAQFEPFTNILNSERSSQIDANSKPASEGHLMSQAIML